MFRVLSVLGLFKVFRDTQGLKPFDLDGKQPRSLARLPQHGGR